MISQRKDSYVINPYMSIEMQKLNPSTALDKFIASRKSIPAIQSQFPTVHG
jgi:hypothetical protein